MIPLLHSTCGMQYNYGRELTLYVAASYPMSQHHIPIMYFIYSSYSTTTYYEHLGQYGVIH